MKTKQRSIKLKGIIKSLREVYRRQTRNKINIKKKRKKTDDKANEIQVELRSGSSGGDDIG